MQLDLIQIKRPLVPLEFFAVALDQDMRSLIDDVDAGTFGHAWDISARTCDRGRRELRVFHLDGMAILRQERLPVLTDADVLAAIVPETRGLRGTELQSRWTCGPDLVHDLQAAGHLQIQRNASATVGPRASHLFSRESIVSFLARRAIGDPRRN